MQEIHSIGGGRFFGGGGAGGDRRLRPHNQSHQQPPLKCPRCDSLNTKFCYYNNYNLSQPRHFCKNCRRYWTKGGVLRNVPVGGGCRKSKRSSKPKTTTASDNNNPSSSSETAPATAPTPLPPEPEHNSNSHSSSESSTLTVAATEAMSAPTSNTASKNDLLLDSHRESKMNPNHNPNPSLESGGIFSEIGNFTSLINSNNEALGFGFGNNDNSNNNNNNSVLDATSFRFGACVTHAHGNGQWQQQQQNHQEYGTASFLDQTVPFEFSSLQQQHGGFGSLDQGFFDLPNTVDQPYWTYSTHWSDQDNNPPLFHFP